MKTDSQSEKKTKKTKRKLLFILSQAVGNASFLTLKIFTCTDGKGRFMFAI